MNYAPLVLIGFNRASTHARVLKNLAQCDELHGVDGRRQAYAFLDAARCLQDAPKVAEERAVMEQFKHDYFPGLQIIARSRNFGCRNNIIQAISDVLARHGRAIIIEDDILVSRTFLLYMDSALEFYESDKRIWCINANTNPLMKVPPNYKHDVYLHPRNMCWGWGIWRDRWEQVDFDMHDWPTDRENSELVEKMDFLDQGMRMMVEAQYAGRLKTWDIQCSYHILKHGLFAVEPRHALSKNIGMGLAGEHCRSAYPIISKQKYYNFIPKLETINPDRSILLALARCGFNRRISVRLLRRLKSEMLRFSSNHDEPLEL